ncbi:MAG TPA: hypothetical protein VGB68_10230 [Pyrinomonadaceae bacterium]
MKTLIESFDRQFLLLDARAREITGKTPSEKLYWQPRRREALFPVNSCGEYILRSAGAVEQAFGGITTRLWDDPFEWTLPEELSTSDLILNYLREVEETRKRGFSLFRSDADLSREIPAPEKLKTIFALLLETIARAENFQGRAIAVFREFSEAKIQTGWTG